MPVLGNQPLPVEHHILAGGATHKDKNMGPKHPDPVGDCPPDQPEAVKRVWFELAECWKLILSKQDRPQFLKYCQLEVECQEAYHLMNTVGRYHEDNTKVYAHTRRWDANLPKLHALARSFGATPVDRNRIPGKVLTVKDRREIAQKYLT